MLTAFRAFAKSWVAKILFGLLILSMGAFGISRYGFQAIKGDEVISAGSRKIDSNEFKRTYDDYKKGVEQQNGGQPLPQDVAEANHLDQIVLNGLATREAFSEMLSKVGVRPSDKLILEQIEKIPDFFDPITGRFDKLTFQRLLANRNMTPKMLDKEFRDQRAAQDWAAGVKNGLAVPRAYGALGAAFFLETRDLSYFLVTPQSVPQPAPPTDAQLAAFVAQNKSRYSLPEMREITFVAFTPETAAAAVGPIDPKELQKRYDFRKDTLSKPETRSVVQIPIKAAASAATVIARLNQGEPAAAIAKSLGVEPVEFVDKPRTAIADPKVGQAAFKMAAGQVAQVQGDLGLSVVKVLAINPGREVSLEEARPMLEAEIRKDMVAQKVYAQSTAFDDARQGGASLAQAAEKVGAQVGHLPPLSAQGVNAAGQQLQNGFPPKILQMAFTLPAGGESETTELGNGVSFAVRVEKVIPAHVPTLAELHDQAAGDYMRSELIKALEARASALAARIRKGESLDAVATSAGYAPVHLAGLSRQNAQSHQQEVPAPVLGRALASTPGDVWTGQAPNALVVGRIDNVQMDPGPTAAQLTEQSRGQLTEQLFREMAESAQAYARNKLKVKTDPARARAAAGFEPLDAGKAKKTPEKKG